MQMMQLRILSAVGTVLTLTTPAEAKYAQVSAPNGSATVIVNLVNGAITNCPAIQNGNTSAPMGACKTIGTLNVVGVADNPANVGITFANNSNVTITNLTNGSLMRCSMMINGQTGNAVGTCVTDKAL